jgi:putative ATPase
MAINNALTAVTKTGNLPVPLHLRNAPTQLMKQMEYGKNYQYAHLGENNFIEQEYLPNPLEDQCFYVPGNNNREEQIKKFLHELWKGKYGY